MTAIFLFRVVNATALTLCKWFYVNVCEPLSWTVFNPDTLLSHQRKCDPELRSYWLNFDLRPLKPLQRIISLLTLTEQRFFSSREK